MDYYQGVVTEYLRTDRSTFVNTECLIVLESGKTTSKGASWYCDVIAVNFRDKSIYLCEVTYSKTLQSLLARLRAWSANWQGVCAAIRRDSSVPDGWGIQPWLFMPQDRYELYRKKLALFTNLGVDGNMPKPKVTFLESVAPWKYDWNRTQAEFAADE